MFFSQIMQPTIPNTVHFLALINLMMTTTAGAREQELQGATSAHAVTQSVANFAMIAET
jgi:hypothetical protein